LNQSTLGHEILYADKSSKDGQLLLRGLFRKTSTWRWRSVKAAFTRCKLACASQVPEMCAQTFHASIIIEVSTRFKVQLVELLITCMKRPRNLARASRLGSC